MPLTVFDIELINSLNGIKFRSFNVQTYIILSDLQKIYQMIHALRSDLTTSQIDACNKKLKEEIKLGNSHAIKQIIRALMRESNNRQNDNISVKQLLDSNGVWQKVIKKSPHKLSEIRRLKAFWELTSIHSHYTSEFIYLGSLLILPAFENFYTLAESELKKHSKNLPNSTRLKLRDYLEILKAELRAQKAALCEIMLLKLEVSAQCGDCKSNDIINYVLNSLYEMGYESKTKTQLQTQGDLAPKIFWHFHCYIFLHGSAKQKLRLKQLAWMKVNSNFILQEVEKQFLIIPTEMRKFGVENQFHRNFLGFIRIRSFKANFFRTHFYLLAQIRLLEHPHFIPILSLQQLLVGKQWIHLNKIKMDISQQISEANYYKNSWFNRIFFSHHCGFYKEWQVCQQKSLLVLLKQMIGFAKALAEQLRTRLLITMDVEIITTNESQEFIKNIITTIDPLIGICKNDEQMQQWHAIKKIFLQTLNYDKDNSTRHIAEKLSDHEQSCILSLERPDSAHRLRMLIKMVDSDTKNNNLCNDIDLLIKQLEQILIGHLEKLPSQNLDNFWKQLFVFYLETCISSTRNAELTCKLNRLILNYSSPSIRQRAEQLESARSTQSSFIYQTRCQALLYSFKESNPPTNESINQYGDLGIRRG